jgi:hypothetical protein
VYVLARSHSVSGTERSVIGVSARRSRSDSGVGVGSKPKLSGGSTGGDGEPLAGEYGGEAAGGSGGENGPGSGSAEDGPGPW